MRHTLRFAGRIAGGCLAPFALIPLGLAYLVLAPVVAVWSLWRETA